MILGTTFADGISAVGGCVAVRDVNAARRTPTKRSCADDFSNGLCCECGAERAGVTRGAEQSVSERTYTTAFTRVCECAGAKEKR
jgi:hypothetical protein